MAYRYVTCTLTFQHCLCNCKTLPYNINIGICTFNKVFPLQNKNTKKNSQKKPTNKQQHETNIMKRSVSSGLNQQCLTLKRSSQDIWRSLIKSTPSPNSVTMATSWMSLLVPGTQNPSTCNRNLTAE